MRLLQPNVGEAKKLAYAHDIDVIQLNDSAATSAFSRLDREAKRIGL